MAMKTRRRVTTVPPCRDYSDRNPVGPILIYKSCATHLELDTLIPRNKRVQDTLNNTSPEFTLHSSARPETCRDWR